VIKQLVSVEMRDIYGALLCLGGERSALSQPLGRLWSKDRKVTGSSQHGLTNNKSCLTNLIAFYDEVTVPTVSGRAVDFVYFDVNKTFGTVSLSPDY